MTFRGNPSDIPFDGADWTGGPPHPRDTPALYDGLLWRRILAYAVDVLAIALVSAMAWVAALIVGILSFGLLIPLGVIVLALVPITYHTYFLGSRGATPGMRLFGVEMWTLAGYEPDYVQAFITTVIFYVSVSMTASLVLLFALFNDRRRTLHDVLAGTVVLRRTNPSE